MCTAATYYQGGHFFGRTLDLSYSYEEQVVITPRRFPLPFRHAAPLAEHLAMVGMAFVQEGYPLYYDAVNEAGLAMAGLNFPGFAHYGDCLPDMDNVSPFEFIPWVLGRCETVAQTRALLSRINLIKEPFSTHLPLTPMHWMIADREESIVVEPLKGGLRVWENPVGVMANAPAFDWHLTNLSQYRSLSPAAPEGGAIPTLSLGEGTAGLPGDLTSPSRFVRAAYTRNHAPAQEGDGLRQFFHILGSVNQVRGSVLTPEGGEERTVYTACCDLDTPAYYYTTYENSRITAVSLGAGQGSELRAFPLRQQPDICWEN